MSEDRAWIRIINKYARPCVDCGKLLPVGENCYWLKSNGIKCPDCYNNINENHKMDADAQKGEQDIDPLDEDNGGNIEVEEQDNRKEDKGIKNPYRKGTKNNFIAEQILEGKKGYEVFQENREKVGKEEPLIYRENIGDGKREPKNPYQQMDQFRKNIDSVENTIKKLQEERKENNPPPQDADVNEEGIPNTEVEANKEEDPTPTPKKNPYEWYLMRIRQLREFCENKDLAGQGFDSISMRPVIYGKAGLDVGIPAEALLYVCTLHWPIETRHEANIKDFNLAEVNPESGDGSHILLGYVKKLAEARIPIMAVGPAGTGKSYLASQLAYDLGFEYGECPMTAGASPTWLLGSHTAEGFKSRPFIEIYENGGVFNFEELDASDPNMLLVANNALESDRLFNPISGKEIVKHNEFIPYATANTFGLGSNRAYTGRERLDFATLDRFRMGRVVLGIDTNLEDQIFNKVNDAA